MPFPRRARAGDDAGRSDRGPVRTPAEIASAHAGLACLAVTLVALAFALVFHDHALVMSEEGQILTEAEAILHGRVLYRDIDCFVAPGVWYLTALLIALFGPDLNPTRIAMAVVFALSTAVVYATGRAVAGPRRALAGAAALAVQRVLAFPLGNFVFYTELALLCGLGCIGLLLRWLETRRDTALWAAGTALAACLLCKQNIGLALALAVSAFLVIARAPRALGRVLGVAAVPCLAAVAYFTAEGAIGALLHGLFVVPFSRFYGGAGVSYLGAFLPASLSPLDVISYTPALFARAYFDAPNGLWSRAMLPLSRAAAMTVYALPVVLTMAACAHLVRRKRRDPRGVLLLLGALALHATAFPRADFPHVAQSLVGFVGLALWLVPAASRAFTMGLATIFTGLAVYTAVLVPAVEFSGRLDVARARVWLPPQEYRIVTAALDWIGRQIPSDDPLMVVPYEAMYYFLAGRLAPHRYTVLLPPNVSQDGGREAVELTEAAGVRWMVETTYRIPGLPPFERYAPVFAAYLRDRYQPVFTVADERGAEQLRILRRLP